MAEKPTGPIELGAPMDYSEHEKTYGFFLSAAKYGTMFVVTLLVAMAIGFFTGAGFITSVFALIFLNIAGVFLLRG